MAQRIDMSQVLSHPLILKAQQQNQQQQQQVVNQPTEQPQELYKPLPKPPQEQQYATIHKQSPSTPSQHQFRMVQLTPVNIPRPPSSEPTSISSVASNNSTLTRRGRLFRGHSMDTEGLYNSDLPSPKPHVLLPNFSINIYPSQGRRLSFRD